MASILDRYGIKEVADVTFYKIDSNGQPAEPVLYLDTLKVSTIEQTAETVDARGGKGNPKLITWDYGKEITVTLEDALFSAKSMSIMFGNGAVDAAASDSAISRISVVRANASSKLPDYFVADMYDSTAKGAVRKKLWMANATTPADAMAWDSSTGVKINKVYDEFGNELKNSTSSISGADAKTNWQGATASAGEKYFVQYTWWVAPIARKVVISGDTFPGTYYVQGDTYARSDVDGSDHFFQFVIPKAKMTAENTITLEAEGDPSVFNMNLTVLRPEDGEMMKLVQYDLIASNG